MLLDELLSSKFVDDPQTKVAGSGIHVFVLL